MNTAPQGGQGGLAEVALVAGVTGTLGAAVAIECIRSGRRVRGVSRGQAAGQPGLELAQRLRGVELTFGDLLNTDLAARMCEGVDTVVFAAGSSGVEASFADPAANLLQSALPWLTMMRSLSRGGRLILLSSQTVYGPSQGEPFTTSSPVRPASPYALHRVLMEEQGRLLSCRYGIEVVSLRLGNVFGEVLDAQRERTHGVVERMLRDLVNDNVAHLYGGGSQSLEILHVDDLARAVVAVIDTRPVEGRFCVYNVRGEQVTVRQIADALRRGLGRGTTVSTPWSPGMERAMAKDVQLDDAAFRAEYDWSAKADARHEIEQLARAWR